MNEENALGFLMEYPKCLGNEIAGFVKSFTESCDNYMLCEIRI